MLKILSMIVLIFSAPAPIDHAERLDPMDRIVGDWISPDGRARQRIEPVMDGSWLAARMWFRDGDDWQLVSVGGIYRRPGTDEWVGVARTRAMDGLELFESTMRVEGEILAHRHRTYQADGTVEDVEEEWHFPTDNRIEYVVFRLVEGSRERWLTGGWVRRAGTPQ